MRSDRFLYYQLFEAESHTYTYILGDWHTREAVIIDPVLETHERDLELLKEEELKLQYILETHVHADHITGAASLKEKTSAKICLSEHSGALRADILLKDGQELKFGKHEVKCLTTPGHTDGCMSYYCEDRVFTGDALLIRGCGRTDFQQGSPDKLFHSVREKLFRLPDETYVYPAHDYNGHTRSEIGLEKKYNPRLKLNLSSFEFSQIMNALKLEPPKKIEVSVPANLRCGFPS
ncbi:MAG: Zn-dependent hydrolase [Deltaproteobacteria bacterium CG11_big_fil_rev_8_21_14_0_20_45_16]|nr:MAG: Zn-dependent hydrolase [Deltaproteobacteria bacterium CG11_big_fil_rev_8_21_14_0_20_45_16]